MRFFSFLPLFLVVFPTHSWGADDFNSVRTIKVGILAPIQWETGQGITQAAQLAAEEINANGGILGKNLELFIGDTEARPEKGIKALQKLVLDNKVHVLVGVYSSGVALAQIDYLFRYKIPLIGTGVASPTLTEKVANDYRRYKYFFRCMINSARIAQQMSSFMLEVAKPKLNLQKVAILAENAKWAYDLVPYLDKGLQEGGLEVVFKEHFDVETKEFLPLISKINDSGAQYLVEVFGHTTSAPFIKQWASVKSIPLGGMDVGSIEGVFWERTGGAALSEVVGHMGGFRVPITPKTIPFFDTYTKKWGETPHYTSYFTYDAMYTLAEALKAVQSLKPDAIIKGLEEVSYTGVLGKIEFQKEDHDLKFGEGYPGVIFVQWQEGGNREVIWPPSLKTGELILPPWWDEQKVQ